jgi:CPA2 family monovalent cation:H+ antiporter-2
MIAATAGGPVLVELGAVLLTIAALGRLAHRIGLPTIPLYLIAGLLLGEGSPVSLDASREFIRIGADVGVVLLLLLLGLEYTPTDLNRAIRANWAAGLVDAVTNFVPGLIAGLVLGWGVQTAVLLGGVTYISSSGIIAKLLSDLDRIANRETPTILAILVIEDLAMAVYLPLISVMLVGVDAVRGTVSVLTAIGVIGIGLAAASRFGHRVSRALDTSSGETLILSVLGLTLLIAGLAEEVRVSAAVGAFIVGLTLAGSVAERGRSLLHPLRDVFGGLFFVFFGLQVDLGALGPALVPAVTLAVVGAATKAFTGWWAAARAGARTPGRLRAACSLIPRGEFSIVIAGFAVGTGVDDRFAPVAACYVLILAVLGSTATRYADRWVPRPASV